MNEMLAVAAGGDGVPRAISPASKLLTLPVARSIEPMLTFDDVEETIFSGSQAMPFGVILNGNVVTEFTAPGSIKGDARIDIGEHGCQCASIPESANSLYENSHRWSQNEIHRTAS